MYALYAFARHTDDLSDNDQSPDTRRGDLLRWRESIGRAFDGSRDDRLLPAVADTVKQFGIPKTYLFDLIDGVEMDLEPRRYETFDDLSRYCYRVASAVGLACLYVWGFTSEKAIEPATRCGTAFQLTNILRDLKEDAGRNRLYLPLRDLQKFDYSEAALFSGEIDQRFTKLIQFETARAEQLYRDAVALEQFLHADGRRAFNLMSLTYLRLLRSIKHRHRELLSRRVGLSTRQKTAIAFSVMCGRRFRDEVKKADRTNLHVIHSPQHVTK